MRKPVPCIVCNKLIELLSVHNSRRNVCIHIYYPKLLYVDYYILYCRN